MKNLYPLLFLFMLSACKQAQNKAVENSQLETAITANPENSNLLSEYQSFVSKLDTLKVETATTAAKKYQELFKNADVEKKDKGFIIFNGYYELLDENINKLHEKDTTDFDPLIMDDESGKGLPVPQKLKEYNDRLKRNGFEFSSTEGIGYIKQDRDFLAEWFYGFVSPTMKVFLQQCNKENKEGLDEDAGFIIESKQFVNRLVWWDNFIQKNPLFLLVDKAKENRKNLLTLFLIGEDNTPTVDLETNKLTDYYKSAYTYLQNNYPSSETNKVANPYFKALLQKDMTKSRALLNNYRKSGTINDF